ncbi:MAG: SurA N-terminal domain-containing protein [Deltaproteobacteria bacterium]|jgi:peptidyl-prolyl cis-trans isomerase D|nr:SurA N-terminal domain-containing protein [Deltaproteobacteria bacterium]
MLDFISKRSGGTLSVLIVGAIALVFIFWGVGGQDGGPTEDIKIDGKSVSPILLYDIQENVIREMRRDNPALTAQDELAARRRALSYLLERHNLLTLAKNMGRKVPSEAINEAVRKFPEFIEGGRFNLKLYEELVPRIFNKSLASFETALSDDILSSQMIEMIQGLVYSSKQSALEDYSFARDTLSLFYAFFPASAFSQSLNPNNEVLSKYYQENKEKWRQPAEIKLDYVELKIADFNNQVEITSDDLNDAYLDQGSDLTMPEELTFSQILFRFSSLEPSPEERKEVLAKAQEAMERAKTEDFKKLATELSQDAVSAEKGGDMGSLRRGQTFPSLEQALFGEGKDNIGKVLGPVETTLGYHLLKADSYQPSRIKTIEEAKEDLTEIVTRRKARRLAVNKIEDLLEALPSAPSTTKLRDTAKNLGLETKTTEFFHDSIGAPSFLSSNETNLKEALQIPLGQASDPVDDPDCLALYLVVEKKPSFIPELSDKKILALVTEDFKATESLKAAKKAAEDFLETVAAEPWDKASEALNPSIEKGKTEPFERLNFYQAGAHLTETDQNEFIGRYCNLAKPGDRVKSPILVGGVTPGYLVLELADFTPADLNSLSAEQLDALRTTNQSSLSYLAFAYWVSARTAANKVKLPAAIEASLMDEPSNKF